MSTTILTTKYIAAACEISERRVRQIAKELGLEPTSRVGGADVFSAAAFKKIKARRTKRGPVRKEAGK